MDAVQNFNLHIFIQYAQYQKITLSAKLRMLAGFDTSFIKRHNVCEQVFLDKKYEDMTKEQLYDEATKEEANESIYV